MCLASHLGCTSCLSMLVSSFESVLLGLVRCMGISRPEGVVCRSVRGSDLITMRSLWMQAASIPTVLWSFRRPPEETNSPLCTAASFQALRHLACNDTVLLPLTATGWALEKKLGSEKGRDGTGQRSAPCGWEMEAAMKPPTSSNRRLVFHDNTIVAPIVCPIPSLRAVILLQAFSLVSTEMPFQLVLP